MSDDKNTIHGGTAITPQPGKLSDKPIIGVDVSPANVRQDTIPDIATEEGKLVSGDDNE